MPEELRQAYNCWVSDRARFRSGRGLQGKTEGNTANSVHCAQGAFSLVGYAGNLKYTPIFLVPGSGLLP